MQMLPAPNPEATNTHPRSSAMIPAKPTKLNPAPFQEFLKKIFGMQSNMKSYEAFNNLLSQSGAVVAGGGVLAQYSNFNSRDIDIYVPQANFLAFYEKLRNKNNFAVRITNAHIAPAYDNSFLKKNNIIARVTGEIGHTGQSRYELVPFDVMVVGRKFDRQDQEVSGKETVLRVVQNFDLVCCEIWYDGKDVWATDASGIREKKTILRPEYRTSLFQHYNVFILTRIAKYRERGFQVNVGCFDSVAPDTFIFRPRTGLAKKTISNPEEWVTKLVLKCAMSTGFAKKDAKVITALRKLDIASLDEALKANAASEGLADDMRSYYFGLIQPIYDIIDSESNNPIYMEYITNFIGDYDDDGNFISASLLQPIGAVRELEIVPASQFESDIDRGNVQIKDLIYFEDITNVREFLKQPNAVVLVVPSLNPVCLCFERDSLKSIYMEKGNNWFYECKRGASLPYDNSIAYVGIPIDETMKAFIPTAQVYAMLKSPNRVFYVKHMLDPANANRAANPSREPERDMIPQKSIALSISHNAAMGAANSYISGNHCQEGSKILLYELHACPYGQQGGRKPVRGAPRKQTLKKKSTPANAKKPIAKTKQSPKPTTPKTRQKQKPKTPKK